MSFLECSRCLFPPLLKLTSTQDCGPFYVFLFYEPPVVCVWGENVFSYSLRGSIVGCVIYFSSTPMGAPSPALLPPCEWEMISVASPSILSSPFLTPCLGLLLFQTECTPASLRPSPVQTRVLFSFSWIFFPSVFVRSNESAAVL